MNDTVIESKIEEMRVRHQELCGFYADILENLGDEGSQIKDNRTGVVLYQPIEKLNFLLKELESMKVEITLIDSIEDLVYGD